MKNVKYSDFLLFSTISSLAFVFSMLFSGCSSTQQYVSSETSKRYARSGRDEKSTDLTGKKRIKFEALFFEANKEKILGNYEKALFLFNTSLSVNPNSAASMFEMAQIYNYGKKWEKALYYSKAAADIDTENIWYQLLYAQSLQVNEKWNELSILYNQLIEKYPYRTSFYDDLAITYMRLGKDEEALGICEKQQQKIGYSEEVAVRKVHILELSKRFEEALVESEKLLSVNPEEYQYYIVKAEIYSAMEKEAEALEVYEEMVQLFPNNPKAHLALADYYNSQEQFEKSFAELSKAFGSEELPVDVKMQILLSYYEFTAVHPEYTINADSLCKLMVQMHPEDPKSYTISGDFLYREGKLKEARDMYTKALELNSDKYPIWYQLLVIDSELGDYNACLLDSENAIERFPNQAMPYFFKGVSCIQLEQHKEALATLKSGKDFVVENDALLAQFYGYIGDAHNSLGEYDLSDVAFDKSLELIPNNELILNNYAYYLSLRNVKLEKAEKMSRKSNALSPNNPSYQDTFGWVLYKMGRYEEAVEWIGKALVQAPDNGVLLEHYGDALFKNGNIQDALAMWEKAKASGEASELIEKKIEDRKVYE